MEEYRESKATKSLRLSADTQERLQKLIDQYRNEADQRRDQQENALIRILDIVESESTRGTHPALEPSLISIDSTISTLIKQVNGIVSGQDSEIEELKKRLDGAILERQAMADSVKSALQEIEVKKPRKNWMRERQKPQHKSRQLRQNAIRPFVKEMTPGPLLQKNPQAMTYC